MAPVAHLGSTWEHSRRVRAGFGVVVVVVVLFFEGANCNSISSARFSVTSGNRLRVGVAIEWSRVIKSASLPSRERELLQEEKKRDRTREREKERVCGNGEIGRKKEEAGRRLLPSQWCSLVS